MKNNQFIFKSFFFTLLFLFVLLCTSFSSKKHPFYVGVTEIRIDSKTNALNVSCKLFQDDFQTALHAVYHKQVDVAKRDPVTSGLIQDYIKKHLMISIDKKLVELTYVGYEIEEEAVWVFFESKLPSKTKKVVVVNTLLYEHFEEQANFIHCYYNEVRKSYKLVNPENTTTFEY